LRKLGEVEAQDGKAIICLVGKHIRGRAGVAAKVFDTVAEGGINIHMISQGASEINISFVVEESDVGETIRRLHQCFFENEGSHQPSAAARKLQASPLAIQVAAQPEVG
jgi:aspartate kinase